MSPTRVLDGRYEMGGVIGHGGMAAVHCGRDIPSGDCVAIKVLRPDLAEDPRFRSRFRSEAETMAGLDHPAIVSIVGTGYDGGEDAADAARVPFIVMEHVAGRSLRELMRAGGVTVEQAIEYLVGVLTALEFSHRAGVVHCDIKPANVMVTPEGAVKLVDFGIARASGERADAITQTLQFLGTPGYLSPEQVRGEPLDAASDLYSAGCLLHELLTGRPPFTGDPISVAYQHVHEEPPAAGTSVPGLDAVLARALAKTRGDRFPSARAFRDALLATTAPQFTE
ncbi:protein kinase [Aeromicrobium sp. 636]|uniref:non-specific serine/threonine protein kinase n=1 Tax=Aeromicrobium senzhongii TaxID=2663859 RepID=A0A8I0EVW9_9ACTN|nr:MULTISPECIES: protein kinase [Aeromicrobium]MBC9226504.1 serine/threonine protein kinase [Aeromicrobium senzhongii]MCQ3998608.1 protein kinase [Aeromicrobium sp. 636]MTB89019.1 protein kinase [Aeromicrobium senzhongii]QNL93707.1 serine/threonine protein kinase [Aeromicrobium senzhongii]